MVSAIQSALGFTFRARAARGKNGKKFTSFLPAVSKDAPTTMSAEVRRWRLHLRTWHTMGSLAREINPVVRLDAVLRGRSTAPRCCPSCGASTPT